MLRANKCTYWIDAKAAKAEPKGCTVVSLEIPSVATSCDAPVRGYGTHLEHSSRIDSAGSIILRLHKSE
jgi:hypothetical protein